MSFFSDIYKNIIEPTSEFLGAPGKILGTAAKETNQQTAKLRAEAPKNLSFFDNLKLTAAQTANFAKNIAKTGAQESPYFAPELRILKVPGTANIVSQLGAKAVNNFIPGAATSVGASLATGNRDPLDIARTALEQGAFNAVGSVIAPAAKLGANKAAGEAKAAYQASPVASEAGGVGFFENLSGKKKPSGSPTTEEIASYKSVADFSKAHPDIAEMMGPQGTKQLFNDAKAAPVRAGNQYAIEQAMKKGDMATAKKLFDELPPNDPYRASMKGTSLDVNPAVDKLIEAVKATKPARKELTLAQSKELSRRTAIGENILSKNSGEAGFQKAKQTLSGPLATKSANSVRDQFSQTDVDSLFNQIQSHPQLRYFEKIRAAEALGKVFDGTVPQKSEISLLEDVFGPKFAKTVIDATKTRGDKIKEGIANVLNIPRAIKSSIDLSAPLRQGIIFSFSRPKTSARAFGASVKSAFSNKFYKEWIRDLKADPNYNRMKDAGLYIADPERVSSGLSGKEEAYMTNLAEKIPLFGPLIKGSERGYVQFLNKQRADVFNDLADKFESQGIADPATLKALAKFVNVATGRGDLGGFERSAAALNTIFFAPRNMAARINMLNPVWYAKLPAPVRKEAIKSFLTTVGVGITILSLAKLGGATVEVDPRSSDFGKIRIGDLRYDIFGGFQQYARFAAQLISGQNKTDAGVQKADRLDTATKFIRSKLAPVPGALVDIAETKDYVGNPVTPGSVAKNLLSPFIANDIANGIQESGLAGAAAVTPSFFGVGVQQYAPRAKTTSTRTRAGRTIRKPKARSRKPKKGRTRLVTGKVRVKRARLKKKVIKV